MLSLLTSHTPPLPTGLSMLSTSPHSCPCMPILLGAMQVEDSTGGAEFTAGKMMTRQQASLNAPDSMGFDFAYGDAAYEAAMEASGTGMLGYTGYEGKDYETDVTDIDDRLDDIKFLHGPFVERSPAGGWPMKYALLGEFNPTMSSVIGTKTFPNEPVPPVTKMVLSVSMSLTFN